MATQPNLHHSAYAAILGGLTTGQEIWLDFLLQHPSLPDTTRATRKKHLISFLSANPLLWGKVLGLYPPAETIVDIIESQHGDVAEANLDQSNKHAATLVRSIAKPVIEQFVDLALAAHIAGNQVVLSKSDLMTFLLEDFTEFSKGAGNSLVSIAGTLNERLIMRAMQNQGMIRDTHFAKTGTDSDGDLIIHSIGGNRPNLGVEIKSYHARERLLRGLQDVKVPKVGIGFFKDASEFNISRTQTLLQTQAAAIYMPQLTLANVNSAAAALTTNESSAFQSKLYRPIERFVTDMLYFYTHAKLPPYL
jgi:hypothetical protein